jgi:hypothetical protein
VTVTGSNVFTWQWRKKRLGTKSIDGQITRKKKLNLSFFPPKTTAGRSMFRRMCMSGPSNTARLHLHVLCLSPLARQNAKAIVVVDCCHRLGPGPWCLYTVHESKARSHSIVFTLLSDKHKRPRCNLFSTNFFVNFPVSTKKCAFDSKKLMGC